MKEISDIIKAYDEAQQLGLQTALATVVHVQGSSYRRPGARMLIREDGQLTGAISGGCLEGDALRKALLVMQEGKSKLVTYDSMDDDEAVFGMSLGCNGIVQVLIEPIIADDPYHPMQFLKAINHERQRSVLVTLFNLHDKRANQYGTCLLCREDGTVINNAAVLTEFLLTEAAQCLQTQQAVFKQFVAAGKSITCFFEVLQPAVKLVIAGAGNDVQPLAAMASILGWEIVIADGRPAYVTTERFGGCQLMVAKPTAFLQNIQHDDYTFYLLMTHNYQYDKAVLQQLLTQQVFYIGMLGPKKKKERMLQELKAEGFDYSIQQLSALHSPVGLDIGGETPEEIALSIIAEIKTILSLRNAAPLRIRPDTIHDHSLLSIQTIIPD